MLLIKKAQTGLLERAAFAVDELSMVRQMLATAVTVELSTLPPYLSAVFSAKPGTNREAVSIIESVALDEMLHMTLAANTLIAIGGNPVINDLDALPSYPGHLPDIAPTLVVSTGSLTREQAHKVFMGIERPDTEARLPGEPAEDHQAHLKLLNHLASSGEYQSIGQFYQEIKQLLIDLAVSNPDLFANPRVDQQVPAAEYFKVKFSVNEKGYVDSLESALEVINLIVAEGEGVQIDTDPIDPYTGQGHQLAHYFKFGEVAFGRRLVKDGSHPSGYSYSGAEVPLDSSDDQIRTIVRNSALDLYKEGSMAYLPAQAFFNTFVRLLNSLHETFNGDPKKLNNAFPLMYELRLAAFKVMEAEVEVTVENSPSPGPIEPPKKLHAGPPFQRVTAKPAVSTNL
jgi:hypothetical protein